MAFTVDPSLEAQLREIARQQGRDVESVVNEALQSFAAAVARRNGANRPPAPSENARYPLRGTVVRYSDPCAPALPDSDWESAR